MRKIPWLPIALAVAVVALALWGFIHGRKEVAEERETEKPVESPSRVVASENGNEVVLDDEARERADIRVTRLQRTEHRTALEALATVVPAQGLIELRSRYAAAAAGAERAAAALDASRREYTRLKTLHGDDRNVSDRALQTAEADWRGDAASLRAAQAESESIAREARQTWGAALGEAATRNTELFLDLAKGERVLLRIALPANSRPTPAPAGANVIGDDGKPRQASLISVAPQVDPRIQGPTYFYTAPAANLLPGSILPAQLPVGEPGPGVVIPASAVVSWQGARWYYAEGAAGHFTRRQLVAGEPVAGGWFLRGLGPFAVVTQGAQMLLSEELRSQIQVGDED